MTQHKLGYSTHKSRNFEGPKTTSINLNTSYSKTGRHTRIKLQKHTSSTSKAFCSMKPPIAGKLFWLAENSKEDGQNRLEIEPPSLWKLTTVTASQKTPMKPELSENELRRIMAAHPSAVLNELRAPEYKIQIADGNIVPFRKQVTLRIFLVGRNFEKTFIALPTMGNILIGLSFSKKHFVTLDFRNNGFQNFPDLSLQLRPKNGKLNCGEFTLKATHKLVVGIFQQVVVPKFAATGIEKSTGRWSYTIISPKVRPHRHTSTQPTTTWLYNNPSNEP